VDFRNTAAKRLQIRPRTIRTGCKSVRVGDDLVLVEGSFCKRISFCFWQETKDMKRAVGKSLKIRDTLQWRMPLRLHTVRVGDQPFTIRFPDMKLLVKLPQ
jgi:hypothetical protein